MLSLALLLQHKGLQILDSLVWFCVCLFCFFLCFSVSVSALFVFFMLNVKSHYRRILNEMSVNVDKKEF